MSIAYLDPGNLESDLQAGSVAQYKVSVYRICRRRNGRGQGGEEEEEAEGPHFDKKCVCVCVCVCVCEGGGWWWDGGSFFNTCTLFHTMQLLWVLLWSTVMGLILQVRPSKTKANTPLAKLDSH